jgi:hypothetical protein
MYGLYKNDHANTNNVGLPVTVRNIYMFLITISALHLKYSLLKPVRHMISGLLRMQTMFVHQLSAENRML